MSGSPGFPLIRVTLIDGEGRERSAYLGGQERRSICVGRAPENDIQVISPYVSRRHAELTPHADGIAFRDLLSTSGSYIDGRRVDEAVVAPGTLIRLGSPDGIAMRLLPAESQPPSVAESRAMPHTEVLRVAQPDGSVYLVTGGRESNARKPGHETEQRLRALIALTSDLLLVDEPTALSDLLLDRAMDILPVERSMVLLDGPDGLLPERWVVRGTRGGTQVLDILTSLSQFADGEARPKVERPESPFDPIRTVTDRVFRDGVGLLTLDALADARLEGSESVVLQSVRAILAVPLSSGRKTFGVLYLDTRRPLRKDDEDALDWLLAAGRQAGTVLEKLELLAAQRRMLDSMMRGLAATIDKRDGLTAGHSARVAHYSVGTAEALGLPRDALYAIHYAALLHDYGKIGVDDAVLKKPAALTDAEYEHIRLHPKYTFEILSKIEFPEALRDLPMMAATHHERWDGRGYPYGLVGEDIPLAGRIIAIGDVYDSLTRRRHYREPMPTGEVLAYLEQGRGSHFDPTVLDAFFAYHRNELAEREDRRAKKRLRAHEAKVRRETVPGSPAPGQTETTADRSPVEPQRDSDDGEATIRRPAP